MTDRRPARMGERRLPYWEALLLTGLRRASRPVARWRQRRAMRTHPVAVLSHRGRMLASGRDAAIIAAVIVFLASALVPAMVTQIPPTSSWPTSSQPPVQICGNSTYLNGPSSAPPGAITVSAGDNSAEFQNQMPADTTYWFAAGTHTFATGLYGVYNTIAPGDGDVFIGAPGAILDGSGYYNHYAFEGAADNVTIEYLTIQDYNAPGGDASVQAAQGTGWDVEHDTIQDNLPGTGVYLGTDDTAQYDCLTGNGEYGFGAYSPYNESPITGGPSNTVVSHNEISYNDVCNWEDVASFPITPPSACGGVGYVGCGCSGAGKFWETLNSVYDDNYEHNNYSAGAWWDTNNAGADIEGNYISDEYGPGIIYEISYNFFIKDNAFVDDAQGVGPTNPGFPETAVYINGSGSDTRVASNFNVVSDVVANSFINNWGGVVVYETADRFCASVGNSSTGTCTLVNPTVADLATCNNGAQGPVSPSKPVAVPAPPTRGSRGRGGTAQGQNFFPYIERAPYYSDCRWKAQNVQVSGNLFYYGPSEIPNCTYADFCGFNGLFSNYGVTFPYLAYVVPEAITYTQNDLFSGNTYCGPWEFDAYDQGNQYSYATWQASPYNQDPGSTMNGPSCAAPPPLFPGTQNRTVTIPVKVGRR